MKQDYVKDLAVIFLIAAIFLTINWIGFFGFDDWEYSEAANKWLSEGLSLGNTHWALRHPHVLPIAASYALFGFGEFQLQISTVIYFFLILTISYFLLEQFISRKAALVSCLLLASAPIMILNATLTMPDTAEAFFVLLSVYLFWRAAQSSAPRRSLFLAGIAAGMSWLTHETTISLLVVYSLLFLAGYRYTRWNYWIMAAGFISVLALEWIYLTALSGDPLYRYAATVASYSAGFTGTTGENFHIGVGEASSTVAGNVSVHWGIDPFLAILVNHEFGLAFWMAIPIAIWLCFSKKVAPQHRELARFLSLLAIVWFVMISYVSGMREQPKYYTVAAIAGIIMIGIAATHYGFAASRRWWTILIIAFVSANLLCFYANNGNPLFAERAAIQLAQETSEIIYTAPRTASIASHLIRLKRLPVTVSADPPPPGALYLLVPCQVADVPCNRNKPHDKKPLPELEKTMAGWTQVWHDDPGRKISGILLEQAGLRPFIPKSIYYKLDYPNMPVTAYRIPNGASGRPAHDGKVN